MKRLACGFAALLGLFQSALSAHDPGLSTTEITFPAGLVELSVGFAPGDIELLLPPGQRSSRDWSEADFNSVLPSLRRLGGRLWEVSGGNGTLAAERIEVALASSNSLIFRLAYPRPEGGRLLLRSLVMERLPPGHRDYVSATDEGGAILFERLAGADEGAMSIPLPAAKNPPPAPAGTVFRGFLRLGVAHIWTGYDHLLFLFGLLVVCRRFKSIVGIISCFTLAHSLTLALATLNLVTIPSRIVEPAIAASIVFVGIENVARGGAEPAGRWALTFAFGLIHGFGFAGALRELGVGQNGRGVALPLFTFNLGVELGQVSVALLVLPIIWQLRRNRTFVMRGVPALSAVVVAAGLYWFLLRTAFA